MHSGWNHLSVPLTVSSLLASDLYPTAVSPAYRFLPLLGYLSTDTLVNGVGYRVKFAFPETLTVSGDLPMRDTVEVSAGWNLIGSISLPVPADSILQIPPGIVVSEYYGDGDGLGNQDTYTVADTLWPSGAYWIKVWADGRLVLDPRSDSRGTLSPVIRESMPRQRSQINGPAG